MRHAPLVATLATCVAIAAPNDTLAVPPDCNRNGIDDQVEGVLARTFCPSLQLHGPETTVNGLTTPVYPVPVEIMGLTGGGPGLTADRLFVVWRQQPLDYPWGDHWVGASGWRPPLPESNPTHDYTALADDPPDRRSGIAPPGMPSGVYELIFHWEYGGTAVNEPHEWHDVWQHGNTWSRPGADFQPTVYAHVYRCDREECDPVAPTEPVAIVIQYWFFFPFNDWVNNHEGDWEGVNVLLSSADPGSARIADVETFAHRVYMTRDPALHATVGEHVRIVDGTHPVLFVGGHGEVEGCNGEVGSGEGSHGLYPAPGRWRETGEGDPFGCFDPPDEVITTTPGPYIHWSDLDVRVLDDPATPCVPYTQAPETAWMTADLRWGTRRVPSVGGSLAENAGNWAPRSPARNGEQRWNRTAASTLAEPWAERGWSRPYARVTESGWEPFALFLDTFTGETSAHPADLSRWTIAGGTWRVTGGALEGIGSGDRSLANRAHFVFERAPDWYDLPFAAIGERATRFACDVAISGVLPEDTQVGVVVQGGDDDRRQVRVVWTRSGPAWEARVVSTEDGGVSYTTHAAAPVAPLTGSSPRLEVVTLDRDVPGVAFHDVRVDGALLFGSVSTPAVGDDARALVADGAAHALFDRVAVSYFREGPDFGYPPFAAWTVPPADTVDSAQSLAWVAGDEKGELVAQRLDLSVDGGASWTRIATLDGAIRTHTWTPDPREEIVSATLRLTVTDGDGEKRVSTTAPFVLAGGSVGIAGEGETQVAPALEIAGDTLLLELPSAADARVRIFDVTGRVVREPVSPARLSGGTHRVEWHRDAAPPLPSGIYFCVADVGGSRLVEKVWVAR